MKLEKGEYLRFRRANVFSVIIKNHIYMKKKEWIISEVVLLVVAVLCSFIYINDLREKGYNPLFWDYIFNSFSNPFFIIVIIPILYVTIIGSLISNDFESGIITSYIGRANYRIEYIISVLALTGVSAITITLMFLFNLILIGLIIGMPITDNTNYYLIYAVEKIGQNRTLLLITQVSLVSLGLTTIGVICNGASLFIRKFKCEIIILMILLTQGHEAYFNNRENIKYSIIGQMVLDIHYPFIQHNPIEKDITMSQCVSVIYSYGMFMTLIIIFFLIVCYSFTRRDINRRQ